MVNIKDNNKKVTNLDTKHTLSEQDVSASHINIVINWISRVDHESVNKLHCLGSLSPELATDHNLAPLGPTLHDEPEDTVASPPYSETSNQLVTERLSLGNCAKTTSSNLIFKQHKNPQFE